MKLRNKKTGEIVTPECFDFCLLRGVENRGIKIKDKWYNSLTEISEEWEDYEEPKGYWCIDWDGGINHIDLLGNPEGGHEEKKKQIGNYFETEEEAEKAVEKLKAWKRLKDASFRLTGWYGGSETITYEFKDKPEGYIPVEECADLDLLFGGEE